MELRKTARQCGKQTRRSSRKIYPKVLTEKLHAFQVVRQCTLATKNDWCMIVEELGQLNTGGWLHIKTATTTSNSSVHKNYDLRRPHTAFLLARGLEQCTKADDPAYASETVNRPADKPSSPKSIGRHLYSHQMRRWPSSGPASQDIKLRTP